VSVPNSAPVDASLLFVLDFDVMHEDWSVFALEDGNKIRARCILASVRGQRVPPQKGDLVAPETQVIVKVDSPPNRRGKKGAPATPEEISDPRGHGGIEVGVLRSTEPWNEYHIKGSQIRIRTKLIMNRVYRIDERYDNLGDPVYVVNFTIIPTIET
jgi:hypothetical protein